MSDLSKTLCIYAVLVSLFILYQPRAVINDDGMPVPLGLGPGKTLFHVQTIMIFLALISIVLQSVMLNVT